MATTATIRVEQETGFLPPLALAFALGEPEGKLGVALRGPPSGPGRDQSLPALAPRYGRRYVGPSAAVAGPRRPGGAGATQPAGRGRLHRVVVSQGVETVVVASASLAVHRRDCRAQPARLAGPKLLTRLRRPAAGAKQGGRVVRASPGRCRVPPAAPSTPAHEARSTAREPSEPKGKLGGEGRRRGWPGEVEPPLAAGRQGDGAPRPAV